MSGPKTIPTSGGSAAWMGFATARIGTAGNLDGSESLCRSRNCLLDRFGPHPAYTPRVAGSTNHATPLSIW